jgi:hypothetical protein
VVHIRLEQLQVQRPRQWGGCWLSIELWQPLQLDEFWRERLRVSREGTALVKKIVSDKVQFFATNSTIQSWGCAKPEKVLDPGGRWGLWNCARMRLTEEKGGAMGQASWRSSFLGHRSATFFAGSES